MTGSGIRSVTEVEGRPPVRGVGFGCFTFDDRRAAGEDVDSLPVSQLADDLIELELVAGWLETERARRIAVFESKRGIDLEGHSSVTAFLRHRCRMSGARALQAVALAHRLPAMPVAYQALSGGDISFDQVRMLANLPEHLHRQLAQDEATLVEAVEPLSVADTRRVLEYWRGAVDGPGCEAAAEELAERRYLYASRTWQGMLKVDALMDPAEGDLFLTALDAATPPPGEDDARSARQRRADALSDIARSFLDWGQASGPRSLMS